MECWDTLRYLTYGSMECWDTLWNLTYGSMECWDTLRNLTNAVWSAGSHSEPQIRQHGVLGHTPNLRYGSMGCWDTFRNLTHTAAGVLWKVIVFKIQGSN
ncbi:hypothetical protein DPMN_098821 [Dreissena polymorpha]|uniref:Uncharacterized protein n=1 Tax=Dreissena polymorpha TaxID=45954 RepID=A0A9D4LCU9_DREPO|nr:hypothetical protein DPMN_098821 [Dreissena polymorpha]